MSAYNRKVLKKMCSGTSFDATDYAMDESGYASFKVLHNSTVEAPFLFERDSETENCLNASNTTAIQTKSSFNSTQFQTPGNETNNSTQYRKSSSSLLETSEGECKFSQSLSTKKRRKSQQTLAHHSSPKKSKKKLFPQPELTSICRTRYYDGFEQLDIVGMLSNTLPALECILEHVSSHTLDVMTQVSQRWAQSVHRSQRAMERLMNHRFKMSLTKENACTHPMMKRRPMQSTNQLVPFNPSNAIQKPNQIQDTSYTHTPLQDSGALVEQMQRIKCPRCGKCSRVFYCQTDEQQTPLTIPNQRTAAAALLSQTLPHAFGALSETKPPLARFYSMDEMKTSSPPYSVGECISVSCKFRFCVHCCGPPHPGEKCLVTEMGTPSKIMMPAERVTPPKRNQKYDSKLSRQRSLKRLNF